MNLKAIRVCVFLSVVASIVFFCRTSVLCDDAFFLRFESRELVYDISREILHSKSKTIVESTGFRVIADRVQFDFSSNIMRASGNATLYFSDAGYPVYAGDIVVNVEFSEAMILTEGSGNKPLFIDLDETFSRFVPELSGINKTPAFIPLPDNNMITCGELTYSSTDKIVFYDAVRKDENGDEKYSAVIVADGPSLKRNNTIRTLTATNTSYYTRAGLESTGWVDSTGTALTYVDVDYLHSGEEGFSYAVPVITQTLTMSDTGLIARVGADEISDTAYAQFFDYTGSRNEFSVEYNRVSGEYSSELDGIFRKAGSTSMAANAMVWNDAYRVSAFYEDARNVALNESASMFYNSNTHSRYRYGHVSLAVDPFVTPLKDYRLAMGVTASRYYNWNRYQIDTPDDFKNTGYVYNRVTLEPELFSGYIALPGGAGAVHRVSYSMTYSNYDYNYYNMSGGFIADDYNARAHDSAYAFNSNLNIIMPFSNRTLFDIEVANNVSGGDETATVFPRIVHSYNGRDYALAGVLYDFESDEWESLRVDVVSRRKGDLRFSYSTSYDLVDDETSSESMRLLIDRPCGTFVIEYEDVNSIFSISFYN
ncbi:MAG TPA: hypothetical protein PLN69_04295 [bacterium]|nr:hypothetical protein [bacterium]